jgi:hypothetical protein
MRQVRDHERLAGPGHHGPCGIFGSFLDSCRYAHGQPATGQGSVPDHEMGMHSMTLRARMQRVLGSDAPGTVGSRLLLADHYHMCQLRYQSRGSAMQLLFSILSTFLIQRDERFRLGKRKQTFFFICGPLVHLPEDKAWNCRWR